MDEQRESAPSDQNRPGLDFVHVGATEAVERAVPGAVRSQLERLERERPPAYPSVLAWLTAGVSRVPRAAVAALLAGAHNPIGLAIGLLVWPILALAYLMYAGLSVPEILNRGAASAASPGGPVGGFTPTTQTGLFSTESPLVAVTLLILPYVAPLIFAIVWVTLGLVFEPWLMRVRGYRRMSRREAELIGPLVADCVLRLRLERAPKILINDSKVPHAFAAKRHIVINRGLYDALRRDEHLSEDELIKEELAGLIAHELWHWRNGDAIGASFVFALALPVTVTYLIGVALLRAQPQPVSPAGEDDMITPALLIAAQWAPKLFGLFLLLLTYPYIHWLILPLYGLDNRRLEYECDQAAVHAGRRQGLYRLLSKLQDFEAGDEGKWWQTLARTHPPIELRLEALEDRQALVRGAGHAAATHDPFAAQA